MMNRVAGWIVVVAIIVLLSSSFEGSPFGPSERTATSSDGLNHLAVYSFGISQSNSPVVPSVQTPSLAPGVNASAPEWVNQTSTFAPAPRPRVDAVFVYDPADSEFVLFGGYSAAAPCSTTAPCPLRDTWVLHGRTWTNVTPTPLTATNSPSGRWGAAASYDPTDAYVMIFGGATAVFSAFSSPYLNDTWSFHANVWTERCAMCVGSGTPMTPRTDAALTWDVVDGVGLLFGGTVAGTISTNPVNDSWTYVSGTWSKRTTPVAPAPRAAASMAYSPADRSVILFGGFGGTGDTWSYAGGTWTALSPASAPSSRGAAALGFNPDNGSLVLFGGCAAASCTSGRLGDTWTWSAAHWTNLTTIIATAPSARGYSGLASASPGLILLFGGLANGPVNDTLQYDQILASTPMATSTTLDVAQSVVLNATAHGLIAGFTFAWVRLPTGCASTNRSLIACTPAGAGSFAVSMSVTDAAGLQLYTFPITVLVNPSPSASATGVPLSGRVPLQVSFTASASGGTPPFTMAWVFGDGRTGTGSNPTHTYFTGGVFPVRLWANDSLGASASAFLNVSAIPQLVLHLAVVPATTHVGSNVTIFANATGGTGTYSYLYTGLPQGCSTANLSVLQCSPSTTGNFSVNVTVTDSGGVSTALTSALSVLPNPNGSPNTSGGPSYLAYWVVIGVIIALALITGIVLYRRRKREPPVVPPVDHPAPEAANLYIPPPRKGKR